MTDVPTEELRPCICADPENCTIVPEGRLCKRLHRAEQGSEAYAIPLGTITDGVVHRMCHYLKSGEPECSKCPAGVTTAYGDGEPGCYGIAFETLQMARSMLYEAALTAQDGWVAVSERLPDECHKVIALFDDSYGFSPILATREGEKWFDETPGSDLRELSSIEYWMEISGTPPYPPPYRAEAGSKP